MKTLKIILLIAFLFCNKIYSQVNLVPNPSFEEYDFCPTTVGEVEGFVKDWKEVSVSPDYFNVCANDFEIVGVPENMMGFQNPKSGNAYTGLFTYSSLLNSGREILSVKLISPFVIGEKYYISFYVNLAMGHIFNSATNGIGCKFSVKEYSINSPPSINNFPHVYTQNIISDTINWIQIFGSFIADSSYEYLMIGNFFDDQNTQVQQLRDLGGAGGNFSYYYIDDVCVSTDSLYTLNWINVSFNYENKNSIKVFPNPVTNNVLYVDGILNTDNILITSLNGVVYHKSEYKSFIDLSDMSDGLYLINIVRNNTTIFTSKFLIKNQ